MVTHLPKICSVIAFREAARCDLEHCFEKIHGACILLNSGTSVIPRIGLEKTEIV